VETVELSPVTLGRMPVLALSSTVLFPGTVLPLHVTDPDSLVLVEDVLASDGCLAVAMIDDAGAPGRDRPRTHDVGCAARIIHSEKLPSGPYNVLIQGVQRVRFIGEVDAKPHYRRMRAELVPEPNEAALGHASRELGRLESVILSLRSSLEDRDAQLCEVLRSTPDPVQLADVLSAAVVQDSLLQQRLLAAQDLRQRLRLLIDALMDVMVRDGEPPKQAQMN
jgi:Lon protease-like protein